MAAEWDGAFTNGRRGGGRRRRPPMSQINVTPFVDVMLVLLVIFMITAPLLTVGVEVDLPETDSPPLSGDDEPLSITITGDGTTYLQEIEVTLTDLIPKLQGDHGAPARRPHLHPGRSRDRIRAGHGGHGRAQRRWLQQCRAGDRAAQGRGRWVSAAGSSPPSSTPAWSSPWCWACRTCSRAMLSIPASGRSW